MIVTSEPEAKELLMMKVYYMARTTDRLAEAASRVLLHCIKSSVFSASVASATAGRTSCDYCRGSYYIVLHCIFGS